MSHANPQARQAGRASVLGSKGRLNGEGGRRERKPRRPPEVKPAFRLKRSIDVFRASNGFLYLLRSGAGDEFAIKPSRADEVIVENLAEGFNSEEDLVKALGCRGCDASGIAATLSELEDLGLLEERGPQLLEAADAQRYDRQLIYFSDLTSAGRSAEELQQSLLNSKVVVLGCGGLGSWTACGLACAGVGSLVLVDDDDVELSNLNRQLLFTECDLGKQKAKTAARALGKHNSRLKVEAVRRRITQPLDLQDLLDGADLLIVTADWPPHELPRWVNRACLDAGVPYITAGQFPPLVRVGPMVLPGNSACLECLESQTRHDYPLYDELAEHRASHPATAATVGAISGLVGSMLAMEAVHLLVGIERPASVDRALIIDLRAMTIASELVSRNPKCPLCSGL